MACELVIRLSVLLSAIALITLTTLASGTASEPVASPSPQQIEQSLRLVVPDRMAHYHIRGLSLACIHNGTVEWTQAFGVARVGGEPVTPESLFQASSIGMPVTAVAVLRLVEQGKLNLDADVSQYLRSCNKFRIPHRVEIQQSLGHRSDLRIYRPCDLLALPSSPTPQEIIALSLWLPQFREP